MAHRIRNLLRSLAICISCILLLAACSKPGSTETESSRKYDASAEEAEIHQKQLQNNEVIEEPLSEAEKLERSKQSQILQNGEFGDISEKTADTLADYFVRCQRLENPEGAACIRAARHEEEPRKPWTTHGTWEYWILTADTGTEYWLAGFTNSASDAFDVYFIYRDTLDGELLYGYYQ